MLLENSLKVCGEPFVAGGKEVWCKVVGFSYLLGSARDLCLWYRIFKAVFEPIFSEWSQWRVQASLKLLNPES